MRPALHGRQAQCLQPEALDCHEHRCDKIGDVRSLAARAASLSIADVHAGQPMSSPLIQTSAVGCADARWRIARFGPPFTALLVGITIFEQSALGQ